MDKEKVIKGLECCNAGTMCDECDYHVSQFCLHELKADALTLLKADEADINVLSEKYTELLDRMLKEQEAKQIVRKQARREYDDGTIEYFAEWFCPHCDSLLKTGFAAPFIQYCYKCGKAVKWDV